MVGLMACENQLMKKVIKFDLRLEESTSIWSAVNIKKIEELTNAGLMMPAGIAAWEKSAVLNKSKVYAYEQMKANRAFPRI